MKQELLDRFLRYVRVYTPSNENSDTSPSTQYQFDLAYMLEKEMKQIGRLLGLPEQLVEKVPIDGLCGKTDEDNLGFTYAELDRYIRTGEIDDEEKKKIFFKKNISIF